MAGPAVERPDWRGVALWASIWLSIGSLMTLYQTLSDLAEGERPEVLHRVIDEFTSAFGACVLFLGVRWLARRFPLEAGVLLRRLPVYVASTLLYSAVHTTSNWLLRSLIYPALGAGAYDYGILRYRYVMELGVDTMAFVIMAVGVHMVERLRAAQAQRLRAAQLEASLARTQLRNLRLQLQPHFLFNALNTVSATMYADPAAADAMIERLAELLRASLRSAQLDEVPLGAELELLDAYLAIQRARFGERLRCLVEVAPGLESWKVPSLLLQPLVENAIRHGRAEQEGSDTIRVVLQQYSAGTYLEVVVENSLPMSSSPPASGSGEGLGLAATAERLQLLYGAAASCDAGPVGDLYRVKLRLPSAGASRLPEISTQVPAE